MQADTTISSVSDFVQRIIELNNVLYKTADLRTKYCFLEDSLMKTSSCFHQLPESNSLPVIFPFLAKSVI